MKLFGFNISRDDSPNRPSAPGSHHKLLSPAALDWLRGETCEPGTGFSNAYEQVAWVYRAVNALAEQVANIPFLFSAGDRGRESLITNGPLLDFYRRPHPHINRFQYWELRIIWLMLRGECFRIPIYLDDRSGSGISPGSRRVLKKILILDPAHFHHIVQDHELIGWRYTGFGPRAPLAAQVFLPEEVWFEKLPNPFDFWRGLAPLRAAAMAARTDFAAGAFMQGTIENNADTGVIVRTEKPLGPEQEEQLSALLRDRKRRAGTPDRPLLLSGVAEIIKPQLSSSDMQFLENRKFSRSEICAAFGVPEEIVTSTDHAKYDVMQGARRNFIENRVAPLCGRLEAEEDVVVKSLDSNAVGWFDLDSLPIMQQARRDRLAAAKTGFEMGVPFNDLNQVLDLGFQALPWGGQGYVASNLKPTGVPQTSGTNGSKTAPTKSDQDPFERALGFFNAPESSPTTSDTSNKNPGKLRRLLFEQRGRVLAAVEKGASLDELGEIDESVAPDLRGSLTEGLANAEAIDQLKERVRRIYNQALREQ